MATKFDVHGGFSTPKDGTEVSFSEGDTFDNAEFGLSDRVIKRLVQRGTLTPVEEPAAQTPPSNPDSDPSGLKASTITRSSKE